MCYELIISRGLQGGVTRKQVPIRTAAGEQVMNAGDGTIARTILLLRISYWIGGVIDALAAMVALIPSVGGIVYGFSDFTPGADYRYAMGSVASLENRAYAAAPSRAE
jgi:hypothetical protein